MTIARVMPSGWGIGDKQTSAQANALDLNTTYAADKRSGQTDNLQAIWTFQNAGRLIKSYVAGATTNNSYTLSSGCSVIDAASITIPGASVTYTLNATGASLNDTVEIRGNNAKPVIVVDAASATTIATLLPRAGTEKAVAEFFFNGTNWQLRRINGNENAARYAYLFPQYWTGTFDMTSGAVPVIATDETNWQAQAKMALKDLGASLPAASGSFRGACMLPNPAGAAQGYGYGFLLNRDHLIDGKTLTSIDLHVDPVTAAAGQFIRYYVRRTPCAVTLNMMTNAVYLSSATYPGLAAPAGLTSGDNVKTMTCNQNNVIDLSTYAYLLVVVIGGNGTGSTNINGALFQHT